MVNFYHDDSTYVERKLDDTLGLEKIIMSWGTLGHSKDIEPLLVQLYDGHRLYHLAAEKKPEARAELSHVVAGLLNADLKISEKELIADILINLMRQAEKDLRQALAERLSVMDGVPLRLVLHLAQDEIGIAEKILRSSPVLDDLDLMYIIQSKSSDYWQAIASREKLNNPVIDTLADTHDLPTACTLAKNEKISLTPHSVSVLAQIAQENLHLARPLLSRPEIPETLAKKLYEIVASEMQNRVEIISGSEEIKLLESVKDVLMEFSVNKESSSPYLPTPAMIKASELFASKGQLTTDLMVKTLKRGQIQSFVAQFSVHASMGVDKVISLLSSAQSNKLAMACKATGFNRDEFIGVYLMTEKVRNPHATINHREFNNALSYFDRLTKSNAEAEIKTI